MAFTEAEIAQYTDLIEKMIWTKRRPPLHLRNLVREGQRVAGSEIELFLVRPLFSDPAQQVEESIAKARHVKTQNVWQVFWKRADLKWHRYPRQPEVKSVEAFLMLVEKDVDHCFWG